MRPRLRRPGGAKPYRPPENACGGYFCETLCSKALAWAWREQDRELMIVGMSAQDVFAGAFFRFQGVP
jgi:hypothetical protein